MSEVSTFRLYLMRALYRARSPVVGSWKLHLELAANCGRMTGYSEAIQLVEQRAFRRMSMPETNKAVAPAI